MVKQDYLMLAHTFKKSKHNIAGWYVSEKLDGTRAFWDGGLSRGKMAKNVPYANCVKDDRLTVQPVATGLWSRSGKVIHAPDYFLDTLPNCLLDGELFIDRGEFQRLRTIVADHSPGSGWHDVKYMVFDSPAWLQFGKDREIKIRSEYSFWIKDAFKWIADLGCNNIERVRDSWNFEHTLIWLEKRCLGENCYLLPQERLPLNYHGAVERAEEKLNEIVVHGGEGLVFRNPISKWETIRSHNLLKFKPWNDAEGIIVGFTSGRETDRGSKLLGLIGALVLSFNGKRLELSGLTDEERAFANATMGLFASTHPGSQMPGTFQGRHFNVGQVVTFKYRELSDDGVPKEARYFRPK